MWNYMIIDWLHLTVEFVDMRWRAATLSQSSNRHYLPYLGIIGGGNAVEKSTVAYLEVMDKFANNKNMMLDVRTTIQLKLKVGKAVNQLEMQIHTATSKYLSKSTYGNQGAALHK